MPLGIVRWRGVNNACLASRNALHEACCGEQADRLLLLNYETLTSDPDKAMAAVYDFIGEKPFVHDFESIEFDAAEFDRRLGTPGLHTVGRRVERQERVPRLTVAAPQNRLRILQLGESD
jgi:hypothetical protein